MPEKRKAMKKIIISSFAVLSLASSMNAQQLPLYSQYYHNQFILNPSMTGVNKDPNVWLIHRNQWKDIPGAPVTNALTLDGNVWENKMGLGLMVFNDVTDIVE